MVNRPASRGPPTHTSVQNTSEPHRVAHYAELSLESSLLTPQVPAIIPYH